MATIVFGDVEPSNFDPEFRQLNDCLYGKKFFDKNNDSVFMNSESLDNQPSKLMHPPFGNGLLGTIYIAYSRHIPLVLRPDDLWLAIVTSFGNYVKNHSEEMRNLFVDHLGKKQLVVTVDSPYMEFTTPEHWKYFISLMASQIKENVKNDIVDWIVPTFSTTTPTDVTVSHIALMGTVSEYFDMKFELSCGIPKVTLEGSLNDWMQLYDKSKKLYTFGVKELSDWADLLLPVLEEFINAYKGMANKDFWQRICTFKTRGSGSQKTFRGWFLVFSPFNEGGKYLLRPLEKVKSDNIYGIVDDDDIVDCGINVQVTIADHNDERNPSNVGLGKTYQAMFYAGLLMTKYQENSVAPKSAWIMVQRKHIVLADMQQELERNLSNSYRKLSKNEHDYMTNLVNFAHHVAEKYYFPNDKLIDLVDQCMSYYWNYGKKDTDNKKFLLWLAEKVHFTYKPNMFAKYIDPNRIDEVCNTYGSK